MTMTQEISPCKKICNLDFSQKYCQTCFRTIYEISNWGNYTLKEKKKIMSKLSKRKFK